MSAKVDSESQQVALDEDHPLSDWSASDGGQDTLSTEPSRQRTPPLLTRSRAKQGSHTSSSLQTTTTPSSQLSTTSYQGSRLKGARSGKSTAIDLGRIPGDTQRKLEVVPKNDITVTLSAAEYEALLKTRNLATSEETKSAPAQALIEETALGSSPITSSLMGPSDGAAANATGHDIKELTGDRRDASSAIPGFLQGLTGKSDMQLLSSGDEDATADKKRKRAGSASDMPDFLQIKGKQTPNTSVRASSAFHDDTSVLHVKSLPASCEVTSIELQDENCKDSYKSLPNLRKGTFASWSSMPGEGLILMSALPELCETINGSAFIFSSKGYHVNLSRVDPRILQAVATVPGAGQSKFTLCIDGRTAVCVSVCVVEDSALSVGAGKGNARRQKYLSGILFSQEFQRLVAVCCMVFQKDVLSAPLAQDALTFGTGLESGPASFKKAKIAPNARLSQSSSLPSSPSSSGKDMLRFEDTVPVYDGRDMHGKFEDYLGRLDTLRAYTEHQGEINPGSVVAVGYAVNQYDSAKRGPSVGFNINWVVVLGEPRV